MPNSSDTPMNPRPSARLKATRRRKASIGSTAWPRCSQEPNRPRRRRLEAAGIDVLDEIDQPGEIHLLVVVLGQVAALRAQQEARVRDLLRHPFHVLRVHG